MLGGTEAAGHAVPVHGRPWPGARRGQDTIAINERWPELVDCMAVSPTGTLIRPNGSPRDMFLHLKPERREEVLALLARIWRAWPR